MLGLPRALSALVIAGLIVLVAVFLPIPLPFVLGLAVVGLIVAGLVALFS